MNLLAPVALVSHLAPAAEVRGMLDRQLSLDLDRQIEEAARDDYHFARLRSGARVQQEKASGFGKSALDRRKCDVAWAQHREAHSASSSQERAASSDAMLVGGGGLRP